MTPDRLDASLLERELALAVIAKPEMLESVHVPPAEWCDRLAGAAFAAVTRLHLAGESVNALTVRDAMQSNGDTVPGWVDEPSWVSFDGAKLAELHERAELRRTRTAARELLAMCEAGKVDSVRLAAHDLAGLQDAMPTGHAFHPMGDLAREAALSALDPKAGASVHMGLECLHEAVGGLLPGSMEVIGADTGVGKSSYVLARALGQAKRGIRVGIVSCEDPALLWGTRAAASMSGVSSLRMLRKVIGEVDPDRDKLEALIAKTPQPFVVLDVQIGKPEIAVLSSMRRMAQAGVQSVYVDYVQAMNCSDTRQPRKDQIRYMASLLKGEADRLGIVLHLVSQLSRPPKDVKVREPSKHDLKESGDLENAAELISLLWLPVPNRTDTVCLKLEKGKAGAAKRMHVLKRNAAGALVEADDYWLERVLADAKGPPRDTGPRGF